MEEDIIKKELEQLKQLGAIPYALLQTRKLKERWKITEQQHEDEMQKKKLQIAKAMSDLQPQERVERSLKAVELLEDIHVTFKAKMALEKKQHLEALQLWMTVLQERYHQQELKVTSAVTETATDVQPVPPMETASTAPPAHKDTHVLGEDQGPSDHTQILRGKAQAQVQEDRFREHAHGVCTPGETKESATQSHDLFLSAPPARADQALSPKARSKVNIIIGDDIACSGHTRCFKPVPLSASHHPTPLQQSPRGRRRWRIRFMQPEKPVLKSWKKRKKHSIYNIGDSSSGGVFRVRRSSLITNGSIQFSSVSSLGPDVSTELGGEMMRVEEVESGC